MVADTETNSKMINQLMAWYAEFPFPEYQPAGMDIPTTVANSSLCHVSVTKFMQAHGFERSDPERGERCAGVTADVCKFTVQMLNQFADSGTFETTLTPAAIVGDCMACHDTAISPAHGKENCYECHGDPHA